MRSADFFKQHPKAGNRHVGRTIVKLYDKQQHNQVLKRVGAKGNFGISNHQRSMPMVPIDLYHSYK